MSVGQDVRFVTGEDELEEALWASTVHVIGKHHVAYGSYWLVVLSTYATGHA